jgi:hypothetical protein
VEAYPVCSSSGARLFLHKGDPGLLIPWEPKLFPNPANDYLRIQSNRDDEQIHVEIHDLSGRTLLIRDLKLKGFFTTLDLNLINGVYLVRITNSGNEKLTRKLLINR